MGGMVSREVSVICTAKNAASTIGDSIRSILAQDFQNWEMIIVDDGSTDDTVNVVRGLAHTDARLKLFTTGGVGRGHALNRAVAEANAELVANLDADDASHPYRLRYQLEAMKQHPQFAIMSTDWIRTYGTGSPQWPDIGVDMPFEVSDVTEALAFHNPAYHSSVMMHKAAIVGLGGYSEVRQSKFDYDLCVRAAAAGLRLGRARLPLVAQRIHPGQSYMNAPKLRLLVASLGVQLRAMRVLGVQKRYLPLILARFLWGLLPQRVRLRVRDLRASRRLRKTQSR
jgi:glycosyltransferase involved in cell wall biosynthesis